VDPGGKGKFSASEPLSEKPVGCRTAFAGNLSFKITEDAIGALANSAGCGEIAKIRWLNDKNTGKFKGCAYIEFAEEESLDEFVKRNGCNLMGRPVRIDYAAGRK